MSGACEFIHSILTHCSGNVTGIKATMSMVKFCSFVAIIISAASEVRAQEDTSECCLKAG